jgi:hypothetical protein
MDEAYEMFIGGEAYATAELEFVATDTNVADTISSSSLVEAAMYGARFGVAGALVVIEHEPGDGSSIARWFGSQEAIGRLLDDYFADDPAARLGYLPAPTPV